MTLFDGLNWQALALKASVIALVAGTIFSAGVYTGVKINSPANVAVAQHKQDVKQHKAAVVASDAGKDRGAKQQGNTKAQVQIVHDTKTVFVDVPGNCPADPVIDPAVLDAYNKAGH